MSDKTKINDGGSAFPVLRESGNPDMPLFMASAGMTLRDWFAGQALAGMAASEDEFGGTRTVDERASWAFEQAEAMARSTIAAIEEWLDVPDCDRKEVALNRILAAWPDKLLARKS